MIDVYCHDLDSSTPCVCVVSDDGKLTWSPVKTTRSYVKDAASDQNSESAKDSSSDSEDLKPSQITTMGFKRQCGVPGFEIETHNDDDAFWVATSCFPDSGTLENILVVMLSPPPCLVNYLNKNITVTVRLVYY